MTGLVSPSEEPSGSVPADPTPRRLDLSLQLLASGVTTRTVALAVVTSLMAGGVGRLQAWPLWAIVLAMVLPVMPVFVSRPPSYAATTVPWPFSTCWCLPRRATSSSTSPR